MDPSPSLSKILNNWSKYCSPAAPWHNDHQKMVTTTITITIIIMASIRLPFAWSHHHNLSTTFGIIAINSRLIFSLSILPLGQSSMNPFLIILKNIRIILVVEAFKQSLLKCPPFFPRLPPTLYLMVFQDGIFRETRRLNWSGVRISKGSKNTFDWEFSKLKLFWIPCL